MEGMSTGVPRILPSGDAEQSTGEQNGTFDGTFLTCMVKGDVGASLVSNLVPRTLAPTGESSTQLLAPPS